MDSFIIKRMQRPTQTEQVMYAYSLRAQEYTNVLGSLEATSSTDQENIKNWTYKIYL